MLVMVRLLVMLGLVTVVAVIAFASRWARARSAARPRPMPPLDRTLTADTPRTWVVFTTQYCATCEPTMERIKRSDPNAQVLKIDVADRPDLARRYDVRRAPTVLVADEDGTIRARFDDGVSDEELTSPLV